MPRPRRPRSPPPRPPGPAVERRSGSPSSVREGAARATCAAPGPSNRRAPRLRSRTRRRARRLARPRGAHRARRLRTRSRPWPPTSCPAAAPFAFSDQWVVWLVGASQLVAQPRNLTGRAARRGDRARVRAARPPRRSPAQSLVFHRAGRSGSPDPACSTSGTGRGSGYCVRTERRCPTAQPLFRRRASSLYVRSTYTRQELLLGPPVPPRAEARPLSLRHHADRAAATPGREPGHSRHRVGYPGRQAAPARAPSARRGSPPRCGPRRSGRCEAYVTRLRRSQGGVSTTTAAVLDRSAVSPERTATAAG